MIAGEWLAVLTRDQEGSLFYAFFDKAPAVVALSALVRYQMSDPVPGGNKCQ